jgi:hypothetical protein
MDLHLHLALSADGGLLALGVPAERGSLIRVWDTTSGRLVAFLNAEKAVSCLAYSSCGRILAGGLEDGRVSVWESATLSERQTWRGHHDAIRALAFSAGGQALASGSDDTTAVVWALWPGRADGRGFAALWDDLGRPDAKVAFAAARAWHAAGATGLRQIEARLRPASAPPPAHVARLITALASDSRPAREEATRELANYAELVEPALRVALRAARDPEQRTRLRRLLAPLERGRLSARQRREARAVEIVERLGSREAVAFLRRLGQGVAHATLTREAKGARERLELPR